MSDIDNVLFDLAYQQGKTVSECLYDVYNKGRADVIDEAIELLKTYPTVKAMGEILKLKEQG